MTSIHDRTTGRAGAPLMNIRVKLVNWEEGNYLITDKPRPRGEIHIGGDNIATGYFKNEKKTDEDFYDEDGRRWFRTGDIGEVFEDGVLKIVDRKKDLVKLQHGEYVSYGKVEAVLKTCPIIDNVCLYADPSKNYLIAIVVPDRSQLKDLAAKSNDAQSLEDLIKDSEIEKKIVALAVSYGQRNGLERFELPTKLILTLEEWTPDSGLVTAAFKIRRRQIVDHYKQDIDRIYV